MSDKWVGKSVSIHCRDDIGVFQGIIKRVSHTEVVITKAVRNGIPLKKNNVEVTLSARDIVKFDLISCSNVPSIPLKPVPTVATNTGMVTSLEDQFDGMSLMNNGKQHQQQQQSQPQPQSEPFQNGAGSAFKLASKSPAPIKYANNTNSANSQSKGDNGGSMKSTSHPIDINGSASKTNHLVANASNGGSFGNGRPGPVSQSYTEGSAKKNPANGKQARSRKNLAKDSTFGSPDDDPLLMDEEFDFEKNLALFDKQAIWNEIDAIQTKGVEGDKQRQAPNSAAKTKYRHDENVLASTPAQYRQIEIDCPVPAIGRQEYVTDEGLVIPSIPATLRKKIEEAAVQSGLSQQRQNDILARGATELALQLLGGSRRLTPNNQHQWPKIVVVCDKLNEDVNEVGYTTARLLACHGLETVVSVPHITNHILLNLELALYMATGNKCTADVNTLPPCDLVIAAVTTRKLSERLRTWIANSRAPVLAIDPPGSGIEGISIKCSILPILPLNGIDVNDACGRLYLCNIGIPNRCFTVAGITYKSPFDKFVIPIHRRKED